MRKFSNFNSFQISRLLHNYSKYNSINYIPQLIQSFVRPWSLIQQIAKRPHNFGLQQLFQVLKTQASSLKANFFVLFHNLIALR